MIKTLNYVYTNMTIVLFSTNHKEIFLIAIYAKESINIYCRRARILCQEKPHDFQFGAILYSAILTKRFWLRSADT